MEQQINPQEIMSKLVQLQKQVNQLREDFEDSQLTAEDIEALEKSEEEYKNGSLTTLEEIEKMRKQNV